VALTADQVRADVAELLFQEPHEVADTENLLNAGLDSIRVLSLVERWREAGAEVSFVELVERPTLAAWWELLCARAGR
jgi:aryl carrier-like protein